MNTKRTRRLTLGAVAAIAALGLAACSSGGSSGSDDTKGSGGDTIKVGFSQLGAESGWRTANTDSVKAAFTKDKGFDLTFVDAQQKQENQIKAIRDFIDQGVDAIAFSPVVETGWDQVLQEAKDAEIPVVLVDRTVKTSVSDPYATYIGNDFEKEGETAVAWIKKNAADAKIFELQGTLGSSAQVDREKPVDSELGSQIVGKASGNFTRAEGKAATEAALQAYPNMTMIVSHNDDMALGAIEAIEAAGKKPGTDIKIVSFDGVRDGLQALHDKKINYIVECNPVYGDQIADLVKKVVNGEDVAKSTIVPDEAFDQTITQETIDARKY
ncbi:ABC transporter substrate-binding protein [Luteimicrobium xylanilyticum]|uniref:ABC transporter periplasmic-binding protein n=1 Tax=Luteimicrobium xylanilyticum TaxID=1133546 RepID=A0A5P9Q7R1_9MICO|nr:ABC transporter substrate-binding protein [Luteimicrobium xylanilyticum]QFU97120.1 ABC transporter periplasmic-binding protein [Luteimicrobium xylanilyticum]